jgi:RHS repeat-associated protein
MPNSHTPETKATSFSAKEKDEETQYSYFGARYYNSDISIWLSVDPMSDKYPNLSPFMYCAGNTVILVDPDGRQIFIHGEDAQKTVDEIQKTTSLTLIYDPTTKKLIAIGEPKNDYDKVLQNASTDKVVQVNLITTKQTEISVDGQNVEIDIGGFGGNRETKDASGNTVIKTQQFFNFDQAAKEEKDNGNSIGTNASHEILESYFAGKDSPNAKAPVGKNNTVYNIKAYLKAHYKANNVDHNFKERITIENNNEIIKFKYERKVYDIDE